MFGIKVEPCIFSNYFRNVFIFNKNIHYLCLLVHYCEGNEASESDSKIFLKKNKQERLPLKILKIIENTVKQCGLMILVIKKYYQATIIK